MSNEKTKKSKKEVIKDIIFLAVAALLIVFVCYWFFGSNCKYIKNGDGYKLIKYFDEKGVTEITIDYVNGDKDKPVNAISSGAFGSNKNLNTIHIGHSVNEIGKMAFSECAGLEQILVSENNAAYSDDEGVLYNKDKTTLICYPISRYVYLMEKFGYTAEDETDESVTYFKTDVYTYIIPNTVTTVCEKAFAGAKIAKVKMPYSLKTIEEKAFYKCTLLEEILSNGDGEESNYSLPIYLEYIGAEAFRYCEKLGYIMIPESVTFIGTCAFRDTGTNLDEVAQKYTSFNVALSKDEFEKNVETGNKWYRGNEEDIKYANN